MACLTKVVLPLQTILWQNICRFFASPVSSIFSFIASQGWTFLCKHKKEASLFVYSLLELVTVILDYFDFKKWGVPLTFLLLSALVFIAVFCDHYKDRNATETKSQYELQLGEVEVLLSLFQSADNLIQVIETAKNRKITFRFLKAFPLFLGLHTLAHYVYNKHYRRSSHGLSPHELTKVSPSQEDHRDPPDNQSMPASTSVRDDEAGTTVTSVNNSHESGASASSVNPVAILIEDNSKTQTHMSGKHLHRRFPHKGDEIGSNYVSSRKHDVSSLKDLPTDSRNDESMPSTTSEGDLNVIMEATVDPPLPSDLLASTTTQDASVEVDITGTTEAQTDLNDKKLRQRLPIKDDKIAIDYWPPENHDKSSDDDSSDDSSEDESMPGCTSVGNDAAEPFPKVTKEDEVVSSHSSPHEQDDASTVGRLIRTEKIPCRPPKRGQIKRKIFAEVIQQLSGSSSAQPKAAGEQSQLEIQATSGGNVLTEGKSRNLPAESSH